MCIHTVLNFFYLIPPSQFKFLWLLQKVMGLGRGSFVYFITMISFSVVYLIFLFLVSIFIFLTQLNNFFRLQKINLFQKNLTSFELYFVLIIQLILLLEYSFESTTVSFLNKKNFMGFDTLQTKLFFKVLTNCKRVFTSSFIKKLVLLRLQCILIT